jgi:hypothetical protein
MRKSSVCVFIGSSRTLLKQKRPRVFPDPQPFLKTQKPGAVSIRPRLSLR